jgi:Flp pilus assembly protein TadD
MMLLKGKIGLLSAAALALTLTTSAFAQPATPVPAGGSSNPHAVNLYNLGLTAYKQGAQESAIIFFKRACDIDPNLADAQYNLGMLFQSEKRVKEAVPRYLEVLRVKPTDPDAHYQLALCYIDLGQGADARTQLQTIAPNNPHFPDAQKRLSLLDSGQTAPVQAPALDSSYQSQPPANTVRNTESGGSPSSNLPPDGGISSNALAPLQTTTAPPVQAQPIIQPQVISAVPVQTSAPPQQPLTQQPTQSAAFQNPPQSPQTMPPSVGQLNKDFNAQSTSPVPVLANTQVRVIANGFNAPAGLAFDRQGNLYVANFLTNTVDRIFADGSREKFCFGSNLKGPIGLAVDGANNLYVANYLGGTVARISPSGVSAIIASGFKKPYYLTLDKDGNLFVSQQEDNSIVRISLPKATAARP